MHRSSEKRRPMKKEYYDYLVERCPQAKEILEDPQPILIVENTYRISGHSKSDGNLYRTKEEISAWKEKDPIRTFAGRMEAQGILTKAETDALWAEAETAISLAESTLAR